MKIFIAVTGLDGAQRGRLERALAGHEIRHGDDLPSDPERAAAVAESAVVFGNVPVEWLRAAPPLRWVQLDSAGVDAYLDLNATRRDGLVALTHLRNFYDRAVAEAAMGGMLAFYRQLPRLLAAQRERRWIKPEVESAIGQLHGATIVILGAGAIGRRLETLLRAFEADVWLFARRTPGARLRTLAELDAVLGSADVVINTLPHTPETIGLFGRERLARLRPAALLVNVGRGSALDEAALLEALEGGRLAGAVLDVTAAEPLPAQHPFWGHPRVILTQHTAGRFPGENAAKVDRFLANFSRFTRGEPFPDPVDTARGY